MFVRRLSNMKVSEGSKAVLQCEVAGSPQPHVTWFVDGVQLHSSADISISQHGALCCLVISEVLCEDGALYTVTAVNQYGTDSTTAYLTVISQLLALASSSAAAVCLSVSLSVCLSVCV